MTFSDSLTSTIALIFLPLIAFLLSPIFLIRHLISLLAKIFRSDFVSQVSIRSSVWTKDTIHTSPTSNITTTVILDGPVCRETLIKDFKNNIFQRRKINGELEYGRLMQYFVYWLCWPFWICDTKFKLEKHIKYYNGSVNDGEFVEGQQQLVKISNEINRTAWSEKQSPWCIIIFPTYRDGNNPKVQRSAWVFSIHHSLADSFAVQNLFKTLMDGKMAISVFNDVTAPKEEAVNENTTTTGSIKRRLSIPFRSIYEAVEDLKECSKDCNALKMDESDLIKDRQIVYSERIAFEEIRKVQNINGVSYTAVLAAAVGGGLRQFMEHRDVPIPAYMHFMFPYSHPGHTGELSNYQSFVFLKVPVGSTNDPRKRLRMMERDILKKRNSLLPETYSIAPLVVGGMFGSVIRDTYKILLSTGVMINLSVSTDEPLYFQGQKVDDIFFLSGPLPGSVGLFFLFSHYNNGLKIAVCLSESFSVNSLMAEELLACIETEISKFRMLTPPYKN